MPSVNPILFFDGHCGVCARSVHWLLKRDRRGQLQFASLQGTTYASLKIAGKPQDVSTAVLLENAVLYTQSTAVLRALVSIGGFWSFIGRVLLIVPRALRDSIYRAIAARRNKLMPATDSCPIPSESQRRRMLP
jgi:predicted DCC family thiol-disulfide oxidoreductase YuxK